MRYLKHSNLLARGGRLALIALLALALSCGGDPGPETPVEPTRTAETNPQCTLMATVVGATVTAAVTLTYMTAGCTGATLVTTAGTTTAFCAIPAAGLASRWASASRRAPSPTSSAPSTRRT